MFVVAPRSCPGYVLAVVGLPECNPSVGLVQRFNPVFQRDKDAADELPNHPDNGIEEHRAQRCSGLWIS